MKIDSKRIRETSDPILANVEKTYTHSFPETERRDFSLFLELMEKNDYFKVYTLSNGGQYVGFITIWQFHGFAYVEHFAVDESARNGGLGGTAMKQFMEKITTPIVLEVELPTDEMSTRRIGFYERLGFKLDPNEYQQPPYRENASWLPMRLMSYGDIDLSTDFDTVKETLYQHVYFSYFDFTRR